MFCSEAFLPFLCCYVELQFSSLRSVQVKSVIFPYLDAAPFISSMYWVSSVKGVSEDSVYRFVKNVKDCIKWLQTMNWCTLKNLIC